MMSLYFSFFYFFGKPTSGGLATGYLLPSRPARGGLEGEPLCGGGIAISAEGFYKFEAKLRWQFCVHERTADGGWRKAKRAVKT
jgi:hypothetical protein